MSLSYRQAKRLKKRFEEQGASGLVHGLRGKPSNRKVDAGQRQRVLALFQEKYHDFGATLAADMGVELVSPVAGPEPVGASGDTAVSPLTIDDFAVDERTGKVTACPSGRVPLETIHDAEAGTTTIEMRAADCGNCPFRTACPIKNKADRYRLSYTDKQRRLEERRQEEKTDVFKERYAKRSGVESTNSGMKRRLGLGKLRVRGRKAVFHAIYLKVAGWNLLRAVASGRLAGTGKARGGPRDGSGVCGAPAGRESEAPIGIVPTNSGFASRPQEYADFHRRVLSAASMFNV